LVGFLHAANTRGLSLWRIQEGQESRKAEPKTTLPLRHPPASALGSLPSVALSSGRVKKCNIGKIRRQKKEVVLRI
jgi:hypothetical protein